MSIARLSPTRIANAVALGLVVGAVLVIVQTASQEDELGRAAFAAVHSDGASLVGWIARNRLPLALVLLVLAVALLVGLAASRYRHTDPRLAAVEPDPDRAPKSLIQLQLLAPHLTERQALAAEVLRLAVHGGARLTADRSGRLLVEPTGRTAGLEPALERLSRALFGEGGAAVALDDAQVREALRRLRLEEARRLRRSRLLRRYPHELRHTLVRMALAVVVLCGMLGVMPGLGAFDELDVLHQLVARYELDEDDLRVLGDRLVITGSLLLVLLCGVLVLVGIKSFTAALPRSARFTTTRRGAAAARAVLDAIDGLRDGRRLAGLSLRRLEERLPLALALEEPQTLLAVLRQRLRSGERAPDWLGIAQPDDLGGLVRAMRSALGGPEGAWHRDAAPLPATFRNRPIRPADYAAFRVDLERGGPCAFDDWLEARTNA